jgi:hypothetical protein
MANRRPPRLVAERTTTSAVGRERAVHQTSTTTA